MKTPYKVGYRVRLIRLDGTVTVKCYPIHDLWGDETCNRNVSFLFSGEESFSHTDLIRHEFDTSPVVVPDGGVWFIARSSGMTWGRAQTEKQAVANMRRQGGSFKTYVVHRVSKWTQVDGMGSLTFPAGIDPVKTFDSRKKVKA